MRFRVTGADRATGVELELTVEAASAEAASAAANARGLLVSECVSEGGESTPAAAATATAATAAAQPATRSCPFCAETINAKAVKCRWCGEMLDARPGAPLPAPRVTPPPIPQPPPPRPPPPIPADPLAQLAVATQAPRQHGSSAKPGATPAGTRTAASRCLGLVTLVLLVIGAVWLLIGSGDGGDHGSSLPISPTTFVDFDSRFCVHSRLTDLQKSREIERLKGTRVRWEGVVSHVSEDAVGVKHKTTTLTYDVLLRIPEAGRAVLPMLGDGEKIVYEGTINDYGTVLPHGLKDGRVISHSPLNDGDRLIFLADTETTVMNAILGKSGE